MRFVSIQKLRGLAAVSVVLYHVNEYLVTIGESRDTIFRYFKVPFGFFGITLFFVISGFIMAYIVNNNPEKFLLRRFVRIYPPFIAAVALVIGLKYIILGKFGLPSVQALLLLPAGDIEYPLGIEWTLVYEVFFYLICLIFTFRALRGRAFYLFLICWLATVAIAQYAGFSKTVMEPDIFEVFLSGFNIPFISGGLAFYAFSRTEKPKTSIGFAMLAASAALIISGLALEDVLYKLFAVSAGMAMLVYCLTHVEKSVKGQKTWAELLGDYSYGIYLVHVPAIVMVYMLGMKAFGALGSAMGCVALVFALSIGGVYGRFDVFLHKRLKNLFVGA